MSEAGVSETERGHLGIAVVDRNKATERRSYVLFRPDGRVIPLQQVGRGPWMLGDFGEWYHCNVQVGGQWFRDESFIVSAIQKVPYA